MADALNRLHFFERAAETYIEALSTGRPLKAMPAEVAEPTAWQWETYEGSTERNLQAIMAILDRDGEDYRD